MNITEALLTVNRYSRPGARLDSVLAIIFHWVAHPMTSARFNRRYFEDRKNGEEGYGSAHYIVGLEGEILRCIPEVEKAYHVGELANVDPASGRVYTDWARGHFAIYASAPQYTSPNRCTIGVELCHTDWAGHFTAATLISAIELGADLCRRYSLDPLQDVATHQMVAGWKDCPRLWVENPDLFESFKKQVGEVLHG